MKSAVSREFFMEIGVEEMPAQIIAAALRDLQENAQKRFAAANLSHVPLCGYATPRRLILHTPQLAAQQADRTETISGPPAKIAFDGQGQPTPAAIGFAKSANVPLSELVVAKTEKGEYLTVEKKITGRPTPALLEEIVPDLIGALRFSKAMRWNSPVSFIRPIRWLVALYNGEIIPCSYAGVTAGAASYGHRLMASESFQAADFRSFQEALLTRFVITDPTTRYTQIKTEMNALAQEVGGAVDEDDALLWQAAFSTEYPVALRGLFDRAYLALPKEVISTVMKEHQGYFPMYDAGTREMLPHFIAIANNRDKHGVIQRGNERVLRARLNDAQFFFHEDRKATLADRLPALRGVSFHERLGTLYDKTERLVALSKCIAEKTAQQNHRRDAENAEVGAVEAAGLCKCDLTTGIVREFPSLQGVMGRILTDDPTIGTAIEEHYLPRFPGDRLPKTAAGQILSIADKLDTLVGCFGIGAIPTGSEDPYALRRQGTGIIQILSETARFASFVLRDALCEAVNGYNKISGIVFPLEATVNAVHQFLNQRISAHLQSYKIRYDLIDAVLVSRPLSPYNIFNLARALADFAAQPLFDPLLVCYKRAARILPDPVAGTLNPSLLTPGADHALYKAAVAAEERVAIHYNNQSFRLALESLATLYDPLDRFFTEVLVMAPDEKIQRNNLLLVQQVKNLFSPFGDFSKIQEGVSHG